MSSLADDAELSDVEVLLDGGHVDLLAGPAVGNALGPGGVVQGALAGQADLDLLTLSLEEKYRTRLEEH